MPYHFCPYCGSSIEYRIPAQDDKARAICDSCNQIHYHNPRIVVGSVAFWQESVLLCRRAIAPRIGFWSLPAGYLELDESTEAGALREAREEAHAELQIKALLAIYNLVHIQQVQIVYLSELLTPDIQPGTESLEVRLFELDAIPWQDLAFPTVKQALDYAFQVRHQDVFRPDLQADNLQMF